MQTFSLFDAVSPLFLELLSRSLKGAVLVLCILLVRRVLKNRIAPSWRYLLWFSVPLILFWPVFPESKYSLENFTGEVADYRVTEMPRSAPQGPVSWNTLPQERESEPTVSENQSVSPLPAMEINEDKNVTETSLPEPTPLEEALAENLVTPVVSEINQGPLLFMGVVLWGGVVALVLSISAYRIFLFQQLLRSCKPVSDTRALRLLKACQNRIGVRRNVQLQESPLIEAPALTGLLWPKVLLPQGLSETLDATQLRHVFLHELAHVKRWDLLGVWLDQLTLLLHWFNPLVRLASKKMNEDREEACDALALSYLDEGETATYGETLLLLSTQLAGTRTVRVVPGALGIAESKSLLGRRIESILTLKKYRFRTKILFLGMVFVIASLLFTKAVQLDEGEKLFGVIPIPRKSTPNEASVEFTRIPKTNPFAQTETQSVRINGKILGFDGENAANMRLEYYRNGRRSIGRYVTNVHESGTFSFNMRQDEYCAINLNDPKERYTAPIKVISTYDYENQSMEITLQAASARFVEGVVKDKDSGKGLANVRMRLLSYFLPPIGNPSVNNTFNQTVLTDASGHFRFPVSSGTYVVCHDSASSFFSNSFPRKPSEEEIAVYTRRLEIEEADGPVIKEVFEFPPLFTGKLLNPDASPAADQYIRFEGYRRNYDSYSTQTDSLGTFHLYKKPQFVEMKVNSPDRFDAKMPRLHRWIEEEFTSSNENSGVFYLQEPATFRARFLNAKTGKPFTEGRAHSFRYNKPGDSAARDNMSYGFQETATDEPGVFLFPFASPGVEYDFGGDFPGLSYNHALTALATESGEFVDFGDIVLEDKPYVERPRSNHKVEVHVLDLAGKDAKDFDYNHVTLYPGGSSSRGTSMQNQRASSPTTLGPNYASSGMEMICFYAVRDPRNRWAAHPTVFASREDWEQSDERTIKAEEGQWIRGRVLDESTGKALAKVPLTLVQKYDAADIPMLCTFFWETKSDAEGRFAFRMMPGEYALGVNNSYDIFTGGNPEVKGKRSWNLFFTLEKDKPSELEFRIPQPYVGKVLTAAGKPAAEANVKMRWTQYPETTLRTDSNGEFRLFRTPTAYSLLDIELRGYGEPVKQRLLHWFEPGEETPTVFQLSDIEAIGTLVQAATGDPPPGGQDSTIYISAEHPSQSQRYSNVNYFSYSTAEKDGRFRVPNLSPGVRYVFRFGEQESENAMIVIPGEKGNTIDLGTVELPVGP